MPLGGYRGATGN